MAALRHSTLFRTNYRPPIVPLHSLLRTMASYSHLISGKTLIDGRWVDAANGQTFDVVNPSNGQKVGVVPDLGEKDVQTAITAAARAFKSWRETTGQERGAMLGRWFSLMTREMDALAELITAENGKPLADARGEVVYGGGFINWFAAEALRIRGEVLSTPTPSKRMLVIRQPVGPVGVITPWNFPLAMITRKIGAALAAGCTAVIKPAEDTPLTALALARLAEEAGLPAGVINVVTCARHGAATIGQMMCETEELTAISFTGSTAVGRELIRLSAPTVKRVCLELGGHAPLIVFESADVDLAVDGLMASKYRCSGQTCVCSNRVFVHSKIHDRFVERLKEKVAKLRVGDGMAPDTTQGPLINTAAVDKVEKHVKDAVAAGAEVAIGGKRLEGNFFEPTVLTGANVDMLCCREETFGPLAPIIKFENEEDVLRMANKLSVGLAGYFYSQDLSQIWRVAERLEVGMVGVNEGLISAVEPPFGGVKQSGLGREGGAHGLEEYLEMKYICMGGI